MKVAYGVIFFLLISQTYAVIKGQRPWEDQFPFLIALTDTVGGNIICGGVIIAHEWVLTAASCAQNPIGMGAMAGMLFTTSLYSPRWQKREVDFGITHANYILGEPHHDIALLHITEPFEWTEFVSPAELPQPDENPTGEVLFFGYGQGVIGFSDYASEVKRIIVNILDWEECRREVPQKLILDERMVCTEQLSRQSFCNGDHGGPLVIERKNEASLLVGIASWAYLPCGYVKYPNVYVQVSLYLDWINENMKLN